jgi:hypothetical protein
LLRWIVARLQRSKQAPARQATPLLVSQVDVTGPIVPSALHARTLSPSHEDWLGTHSVQAQRLGAQIFPAAVQLVVVTQASGLPSQRWSCPTAQRCESATHTGSAGGFTGSACQRVLSSKQLGAARPEAPARSSQVSRDRWVLRVITGGR